VKLCSVCRNLIWLLTFSAHERAGSNSEIQRRITTFLVNGDVKSEMGVAYLQVSSRPVLEGLEKIQRQCTRFPSRGLKWRPSDYAPKKGVPPAPTDFPFFLRVFYVSFCLTGRRPVDTEAVLYCVLRCVMRYRAVSR
jgi:hypothetical protein